VSDPNWWRQAVVYQIYPRSFADSNGDGIGDLPGITSRIPYLEALGVDAVWLSPFYPSALADGGYDVDDYRDVDPRLGTLRDFDAMAAKLHARGINLIVDLVPNHTSNRHAWFREAVAAPRNSAARDRYIFRDGRGPDGSLPPSDWQSRFGGSAWTRVADGQWYLHLFAEEQPDLNWRNPEVHEDFRTTIRFWSDRGADGFRVDVAHGIAKDLTEPLPAAATLNLDLVLRGAHPYEDRDEVHDIFAEWRQVFDEYDPPRIGVAEAWVHASRRGRYASAAGLGQAFNFDLLDAPFDAEAFHAAIVQGLAEADRAGSSSTWVLSNHDVVRHATRYGLARELTVGERRGGVGRRWVAAGAPAEGYDPVRGLRRARAAALLMLALPGSSYIYQGDELGLPEVTDIPDEARQDPTFRRSGGTDKGRDGCRVPIPWTSDAPSFGFGTGRPHLPQPSWFGDWSVQVQDRDAQSVLSLYRHAVALRRRLQGTEKLEWREATSDVLHFARPGGWHSITNFGAEPVPLPAGNVVISSAALVDDTLPGDSTAWLTER
jgi:alpha-glucosidase